MLDFDVYFEDDFGKKFDEINPRATANERENFMDKELPKARREERKKAKRDAEARFNQEVMGWKKATNKRTGEEAWLTPENVLVDKYGVPIKAMKSKGKKKKYMTPSRKEGKKSFYKIPSG